MTAVDVAAIRAALEAATPGPWAIGAHIPGHEQVAWTDARAAEEGVAEWTISAPDPCPYQETANAELIVLLRNNAEALLTEVKRLRARPVNLSGWVGQSVEWDFTDHLANVDDDGEVSP